MTGVLVLIASPGDTFDERAAVSDALNDWNITRGRRDGVALLPWRYEQHSVPKLGDRAQAIINEQAVSKCDVVVAFFDSRLGTSTGVDVSGTAEEINKAADAGKPVHVYFSEEPLPREVDPEQLQALRDFKKQLEQRGLLGTYSDPADLAGQVTRAVESDIDEKGWSTALPGPRPRSGANLRWEHLHEKEQRGLDKKNKMQYRTTQNDLVVTNDGDADAENLTFTVESIGELHFHMQYDGEPVTVSRGSTMAWLFIASASMGDTGRSVRVQAKWDEDGTPQEREWTVLVRH